MKTADVLPHLDYVLEETDFEGFGALSRGKVRDVYTQAGRKDGEDRIIVVSTDRFTGFDRQLARVSFKGAVNTAVTRFWFERTQDIIQNHVLDFPDPNVLVARRLNVLPVEMVVRGYITGVTDTALWTQYDKGRRDFGDFRLPEGMVKNQQLPQPVLTPTTKFEAHDRNLTSAEILDGMVEPAVWAKMGAAALALYERGQEIAARRGLIIPDTKFEFGLDEAGDLYLIDEIFTPDSSRFWQRGSYEERIEEGLEPEYFDKEFLRLWFADNSKPYEDEVLPPAPEELVAELACRYVTIYEQLTSNEFTFDPSVPIIPRIEANLYDYRLAA